MQQSRRSGGELHIVYRLVLVLHSPLEATDPHKEPRKARLHFVDPHSRSRVHSLQRGEEVLLRAEVREKEPEHPGLRKVANRHRLDWPPSTGASPTWPWEARRAPPLAPLCHRNHLDPMRSILPPLAQEREP